MAGRKYKEIPLFDKYDQLVIKYIDDFGFSCGGLLKHDNCLVFNNLNGYIVVKHKITGFEIHYSYAWIKKYMEEIKNDIKG